MLINMGSRGPDSAGFAVYKEDEDENFKYSLCLNGTDYEKFKKEITNKITISNIEKNSDHVIMKSKDQPSDVIKILNKILMKFLLLVMENPLKYLNKLENQKMS